MDRAERAGLGIALAGHVALMALLSLGLVSTAKLPPMESKSVDVQFVDEVGRRSAAPQATAAPAPSAAPKIAKPAEEAPPAPAPEPKPAPPAPTPKPTPVPPKPAPAPKPAPPAPAPKPAVAKPAPAKTPARPTVEKPAIRPAPATPAPATPAPAPPTRTAAPAAPDDRGRRRPDRPQDGAPAKPAKGAGARLGPDFLKGIADAPKGKVPAPQAATVSPLQLAGLSATIKRQVQPCYDLGSLQGTSAMGIVTILRLRFTKDGAVAGTPTVSDHRGVTDDNRGYVRQIDDVARRAVLRCAPLRLPPELYEGGWEDIEFTFIPGQMG